MSNQILRQLTASCSPSPPGKRQPASSRRRRCPSCDAALATLHAADGQTDGPLIHINGQRIASLKRSWSTAKRRAGITRRLRLYDLRHAFATNLLRSGVALPTVSGLLGHSRTETTTEVYLHIDAAMHRQAIGTLPSVLPAAPCTTICSAKKD